MSVLDRRTEIETPEELPADMPLPSDAKTFFLGGIFLLAILTTAYVAREIVLPLIFAVMLNLLMQPTLRTLERLRVPKALGAILLILVVLATIVGRGAAISGPAEAWIAKLPDGVPRLQERLSFLNAPINALQTFLKAADNFGVVGPQRSAAGPLDGGAILSSVFAGTRSFASGLFTTVLFLYFLLVSGDSFLRRFVELLPRFKSKRQAVDISQQIERDVSGYLITITLMNALVGVATALVMWWTGVRRSGSMGDGRVHSEFCSDSRPRLSGYHFPVRRLAHHRLGLAGLAPRGALRRHSFDRGRDRDSDASRETVYAQSRAPHPVASVLVLAVGRSWRGPFDANSSDYQNCVRPNSAARGSWPYSRGLKAVSVTAGAALWRLAPRP